MPAIVQKFGFDAQSALSNLTRLRSRLKETTEALSEFQNQAGSGKSSLTNVNTGLKQTKKNADSLTLSWKTMARVVQTQFIVAGLHALVSSLQDAVSAARELGIAIEEIQTISGRTQSSRQLTADLLALSDALGAPVEVLAEGLYQTLSNQVVETGQEMQFLAEAQKLATITASETKDAVNALSSIMNSYNLEASEAEHISGTLFKTVELGRLRLSEIANVIGRVTPLTAEMGVAWEEAAAAIAVMTRQGVRADTAVTQLRAVMTKIIRPTKEMSEIFRSWGVEDGQTAIETFGGLTGVLRKLAEETGHSSAEMANLLRRVRTIVGQLAIMTNNGEDMTKAMGEISGATKETSKQWEEFTKSDAKRLNDEMIEFENTLTRIGTDSLPSIRWFLEGLNGVIQETVKGVRQLSGNFDASAEEAEKLQKTAEFFENQREKLNDLHTENQKERFKGLTEAANQYYAELQKQEFRFAAIRDQAIERANNKISSLGKDIQDFYKDAVKDLESFVKSANDRIAKNTQKVADIQRDIESRTRQSQLDRLQSVFKKVAFLERELAKQRQKARKAFGDVGATEESLKRAEVEAKTALELAEQAEQLAKQSGNALLILKTQRRTKEVLKDQQELYKAHNEAISAAVPKVEEVIGKQRESQKEIDELTRQWQELYKSGDLGARSEEVRRKTRQQLDDIESKIKKVLTDTAESGTFLKALGVDQDFGEITLTLTGALNRAQKDWQAEVRRAQEAFAQATIPLNIAADPTGSRKQFAEAVGIERTEREGIGAFQRRVDEAAIELLKEQSRLTNEIQNARVDVNQRLVASRDRLEEFVAIEQAELQGAQQRVHVAALVAENLGLSVDKAKLLKQEYFGSNQAAIQLGSQLIKNAEAVGQGKVLTEEQLTALQGLLELALQRGEIDARQEDLARTQIEALKDANAINEVAVEKEKEKATASGEAVTGAVNLVGQLKLQETAIKNSADAQDQAAASVGRAKEAMKELSTASGEAATSQGNAADAAGRTETATSTIGKTASTQVHGVNTLTNAYVRLEQQALAAALAAAAAARGGGVAHFGGSTNRFFANGSLVRGQDRTLVAAEDGEFIVNRQDSKRFFSELNAMNQGTQPVYREQGGPVTNVGDINVTVQGGDSSQQTVREIAKALRRETQRGNIKYR